MRRENVVSTKHAKICGQRFNDDAFQLRPGVMFKLLKESAVFSIFSFPNHLIEPPTKKRRIIIRNVLNIAPSVPPP